MKRGSNIKNRRRFATRRKANIKLGVHSPSYDFRQIANRSVIIDGKPMSLYALSSKIKSENIKIVGVNIIPAARNLGRYHPKSLPVYSIELAYDDAGKKSIIKLSRNEYNIIRCLGGIQRPIGPAEPKPEVDSNGSKEGGKK